MTARLAKSSGLKEKYLQDVLAKLLAFHPPELPELHQGFFDMGMESVMVEQFRVSRRGRSARRLRLRPALVGHSVPGTQRREKRTSIGHDRNPPALRKYTPCTGVFFWELLTFSDRLPDNRF